MPNDLPLCHLPHLDLNSNGLEPKIGESQPNSPSVIDMVYTYPLLAGNNTSNLDRRLDRVFLRESGPHDPEPLYQVVSQASEQRQDKNRVIPRRDGRKLIGILRTWDRIADITLSEVWLAY
ncbi:uncharacterized protein KY384_005611 [Bacidia gigantensis]|uniref:uncharacterized protein n=1 Tax=Bacidia gigantensis TaxID=2732470 RepID=UPI001D042331|nr:uncharacterized protein KY384_005611 [Bacidia gigantensis]KAG8530128.1 hypothetical protein KY384_005611 [Bacidia gigantensis]